MSDRVIYGGVAVSIALFVFALLFPTAMTAITGANHTYWDSGVWTVFSVLLPMFGIIAFAVALMSYIRGR